MVDGFAFNMLVFPKVNITLFNLRGEYIDYVKHLCLTDDRYALRLLFKVQINSLKLILRRQDQRYATFLKGKQFNGILPLGRNFI